MRCIFCLKEKDPTPEHIIPLSLGGSVVTDRVCKDCNSFLGSDIDAPLINFLPIQHRRAELGLAGHSGKIPSRMQILLGGKQEMIGEDVKPVQALLNPETGKIEHRVLHHVRDVILPDGNKARQIVVDVRDKDQIPKIIARERKRNNLSPLSEEAMDAEIAKLTVETVEKPVIKVNFTIDFSMLRHAMIKMAYEFAFLWLGDDYLDDPAAAELRKAVMSDDPHSTDAIEGYVGEAKASAAFQYWDPTPSHHLAYANAGQGSVIVAVRVFDIFAVAVPVSNHPEKYIVSPQDQEKLRFFTMDATSQKIVDTTFWQEAGRIASEMIRLGRNPPFPDAFGPPATA